MKRKILILGLDCAAPRFLFSDPQLVHLRELMRGGTFGILESVVPPITVPAWRCMATGRDPGQLGVYGFRNRLDYSYSKMGIASSRSFDQPALWDILGSRGYRILLAGVPPSYPPMRVNGISVGCFLTPDPQKNIFTFPPGLSDEIRAWEPDYAVDVREFRTGCKDRLQQEIFSTSRRRFAVLHRLLAEKDWDFFHFVDIGLDRIHHGFWQYADPGHPLYEPGNPYEYVLRDYYRLLDEEIGRILERADSSAITLVASDHGGQPLLGGFCINEWLIRQGYLNLRQYPREVTPFDTPAVDWARTQAWSEGGYYARVFLNLRGREPEGIVPEADRGRLREEIRTALEPLRDDRGNPTGTRVFFPEEVFRQVRGIAPDLIVYPGNLRFRSIGSVGHSALFTRCNDTGPDGCNHSPEGCFILHGKGVPALREAQRGSLLQVAPTLLKLAGVAIPPAMECGPMPFLP